MDEIIFKRLTLDDKDLFDDFFANYPPLISEYTFNNLYTWQHSRQIEFAEYEEGLLILANTKDGRYFMPPIGYKDNKRIITTLLEYGAKNEINILKKADEILINSISELGLNVSEDIDSFDYVYNTEDLAFLRGRKYSNKRGFIKKFVAEYYHTYWDYKDTEECRKSCFEFTEKWFKDRSDILDSSLQNEYNAIKEFLTNYKQMNAVGGVICVDKKIAAYTFGEKLNNNTFVTHFEKADSNYAGIYQTINKVFAENEVYDKYKYINREQDLGIMGIRKAKESYYPAKMIKKYNITI